MSTKKGCARDQNTTQYCAEAVELAKRLAEAEEAIRALVESTNWFPGCECRDCTRIMAMPGVRRAPAALAPGIRRWDGRAARELSGLPDAVRVTGSPAPGPTAAARTRRAGRCGGRAATG